ncbi:amidohydrolase family protein [Saccharopolyspora sp. NPDC002376]
MECDLGDVRGLTEYRQRIRRSSGSPAPAGARRPAPPRRHPAHAGPRGDRQHPPADPHARGHRAQTDPLLAGQAIIATEAIAACTSGAAHANHLDCDTGTIAVGEAADLVVLDRDPGAVPPREIADIRVAMTCVDGQAVHEARSNG